MEQMRHRYPALLTNCFMMYAMPDFIRQIKQLIKLVSNIKKQKVCSRPKNKIEQKNMVRKLHAKSSRISKLFENDENGEFTLTIEEKLEIISERPNFSKLRAAEDAAAFDSE